MKFKMSEKTYDRILSIQLLTVLIIWVIATFSLFRVAVVPSLSMYPTLHIQEALICRTGNEYTYDDIVLFHPFAGDSEVFVKRVIGLPGDHIAVKGGYLYRNGKVVTAEYTKDELITAYEMDEVIVPQNSYFMMGDNRNDSADSHIIGSIPKSQCIARCIFHVLPFWWNAE